MEVVLLGADTSDGLGVSMTPLSHHRSIQAADALRACKCLSCVCTILIGLALSLKEEEEKEEKRALAHLGGSYWPKVGSGDFETCQRVALARVPQLLPQTLACSRRV